MDIVELAKLNKIEELERLFAGAEKGSIDAEALVRAALQAEDPETRKVIHTEISARRDECMALGMGAWHLAALTGEWSYVDGATAEEVESRLPGAPHSGWTPLHLASARGESEIAAKLIELGADVEAREGMSTAFDLALGRDRIETIRVLLGVPGPRRIAELSLRNSDEMLDLLTDSGFDWNAKFSNSVEWRIAAGWHEASEQVAFARRLMDRGYSLDASRLFAILQDLYGSIAEKAPEFIALAVESDSCDFRGQEDLRVGEDDVSCFAFAMEYLSLASAKTLVEAGVSPHKIKVKKSWPESAEKRAWIEAPQQETAALPLDEYILLNDDLLNPQTIASCVATGGTSILGITAMATRSDVPEVESESDDFIEWRTEPGDSEQRAVQYFYVNYDDSDRVGWIDYKVGFDSQERGDEALKLLKKSLTRELGKPSGRKNLKWKVEGMLFGLRPWKECARDGEFFGMQLTREIDEEAMQEEEDTAPPAARELDLETLSTEIRAYVNDLSADCFDVGVDAAEVKIEVKDQSVIVGVGFSFTPYDSKETEDEWATVTWAEEAPLRDEFSLNQEFTAELIQEIGHVVDGYR